MVYQQYCFTTISPPILFLHPNRHKGLLWYHLQCTYKHECRSFSYLTGNGKWPQCYLYDRRGSGSYLKRRLLLVWLIKRISWFYIFVPHRSIALRLSPLEWGILRLLSDNRKTLYYFISTNQKYLDEYLYLQVTKSILRHNHASYIFCMTFWTMWNT